MTKYKTVTKRCSYCSGRGKRYDNYSGYSETCSYCKGNGSYKRKVKRAVAKVRRAGKMKGSPKMDFNRKASKLRGFLRNAGVPDKRLPSLQHIMSHFEEWFDEAKMNKWAQDYARLEGGKPPKTKKLKVLSGGAKVLTAPVGNRKIDLDPEDLDDDIPDGMNDGG